MVSPGGCAVPNAKGKRTVGTEMHEDLIARLDERARAEGRSRSEVINRAVRFLLEHAAVEPAADVPKPKTAPAPRRARR
jgi:Arc/MetJ-type ribon-helix-helix transcriptional regulator